LHDLQTGGEQDQHPHLQPRPRQIHGPPFQQVRPGLSHDAECNRSGAASIGKMKKPKPAYKEK
ncbi:hypothetical protein OAH03_06205, partial [Akkermansiaceae bacterium]|nr:hypothetical protein [Akkermansiaceae bacterium]